MIGSDYEESAIESAESESTASTLLYHEAKCTLNNLGNPPIQMLKLSSEFASVENTLKYSLLMPAVSTSKPLELTLIL